MNEGDKHDGGKVRYELLPTYPIRETAKVLTLGAKKYTDRNWEKGFKWSRAYGATHRHLAAWWDREDLDPETGINHLAHVLCEVMFLLEFTRTHSKHDDRP